LDGLKKLLHFLKTPRFEVRGPSINRASVHRVYGTPQNVLERNLSGKDRAQKGVF
jgi:hypothetical protein